MGICYAYIHCLYGKREKSNSASVGLFESFFFKKKNKSRAIATKSLSLTIVCLCLGYNIQVLNLKDKKLEDEVGFGSVAHVAIHVRGCEETRVGRRNGTIFMGPHPF